jgi:hypothetical protein
MSHIDATLEERGSRYGDFSDHADITQDLKDVMHNTPNWDDLAADQKEALEMTAHKIGRILNGDPDYLDSWHDIIGYIRLVEQRLELMQPKEQPRSAQATKPAAKAERCLDCGEVHEDAITLDMIKKMAREQGFTGDFQVVYLDEDSGEA